jgi:hypothetical protein
VVTLSISTCLSFSLTIVVIFLFFLSQRGQCEFWTLLPHALASRRVNVCIARVARASLETCLIAIPAQEVGIRGSWLSMLSCMVACSRVSLIRELIQGTTRHTASTKRDSLAVFRWSMPILFLASNTFIALLGGDLKETSQRKFSWTTWVLDNDIKWLCGSVWVEYCAVVAFKSS